MSILYLATNTVTGNRYIGVTSKTLDIRKRGHLSAARRGETHMPFLAAIRKHGEDAFEWVVLAEFEKHEDAVAAEIGAIAAMKPEYNATRGGPGVVGIKRSEEWKKMMSERFKGRTLSPEGVAKMIAIARDGYSNKSILCLDDGLLFVSVKAADAHYGVKRGQIGAAARGEWITGAGGRHFMFSKVVLSESERMQIIAEKEIRRNQCREPARIARSRSVVCRETQEQFPSGVAAARALGTSSQLVSNVCAGRIAAANGYSFYYADGGGKRKIRAPNKSDGIPVRCIDDDAVIPNISTAAKRYHVALSTLYAVLRGERQTAGGKSFEYAYPA